MSYIHIFAPEVTNRAINSGHCPDCKRHSYFIGFFQDWFGWRSTCLRCGRSWDDGEWLQLAFERGSRRKSVERAKRRWRKLTALAIEARRAATGNTDAVHESAGRDSGSAQGGSVGNDQG